MEGESGDEVTAEAEGTLRGAAGPDRAQINTNGRKNRDVENGQDALRQFFRLFKLEGYTPKPEIEDASAATPLVANDGIGVGADHGNAFGFALNREGGIDGRRRNLLCQRPRGG